MSKKKPSRPAKRSQKVSKGNAGKTAHKQKTQRSWQRRLFGVLWKLAVLGLVLLVFYLMYLDTMLSKRFANARYEAPALLYSRAMVIDTQQQLQREEILRELQTLDYRNSRYARNPGEYQQQGNDLLVFRRAFDFPDRVEPGVRVRLRFNANEQLVGLESWPEQQALNEIRLEPQLIGRFASDNNEDRLLVGLEQVPVLMQDTLLLVEDQDFYHHFGLKPSSIVRAALANIAAGRTVQGGSTITQQLIKNMYLTHDQTIRRKINEAFMALILDYRFSKDEILEAYFNEVYFGQDRGHAIHGIGLASQFFYGKTPEDLTPAEIAMLIGMVKGPSLYNPYRNPERAQDRRDLVLRLMYSSDLISQTQYLAAIEAPVVTRASNRLVARQRADYVDYVQRELRELVPGNAWQETGLRVFTYFDPWLQTMLEHAVVERMQELPDTEVQAAAVVTDHQTGTLRAMVGGRMPVQGGFNRAFQARRQIGSLIKPFVYTLALEDSAQFSLATILDDSELSLRNERGDEWRPSNFDNEFLGPLPLYQSWLDSRNIPAIQTALAITPAKVREKLYSMGATGAIHAYPSLALGTIDLSPVQVNQLYGFLANHGNGFELSSIAGITTHRGELVYLDQREPLRVFSEEAAYLARYASFGAVEYGTGRMLGRQIQEPLGGKTGSTNELRDSWFVSFDNQYILTVWLGRDDNQPIGLTGSYGGIPVAQRLWQQTGVRALDLTPPNNVQMYAWNADTGIWLAEHCFANTTRASSRPDSVRLPGITRPAYATVDCSEYEQQVQEALQEKAEEERPRSWWRRVFSGG